MAENVDDILDLHANESEEDSFENTLSESNDFNLLFGEDTQFPVSQVQTRARSNTRPESVIATNTTVTVCLFVRHLFSFYPFYFDFHSARIIFDVSSGFYLWNINKTTA